MIDVKTMRTDIVRALTAHTQKVVIVADQDAPKPPYPYTSIKFTNVGTLIGNPNEYMQGGRRVYEQTLEMTLSVTNIGQTVDTATELAYAALMLFKTQHYKLADLGIVVVNTTALTDRTTVLEVGYEYKIGFDVKLRVCSRTTHNTDIIEKANINK